MISPTAASTISGVASAAESSVRRPVVAKTKPRILVRQPYMSRKFCPLQQRGLRATDTVFLDYPPAICQASPSGAISGGFASLVGFLNPQVIVVFHYDREIFGFLKGRVINQNDKRAVKLLSH